MRVARAAGVVAGAGRAVQQPRRPGARAALAALAPLAPAAARAAGRHLPHHRLHTGHSPHIYISATTPIYPTGLKKKNNLKQILHQSVQVQYSTIFLNIILKSLSTNS